MMGKINPFILLIALVLAVFLKPSFNLGKETAINTWPVNSPVSPYTVELLPSPVEYIVLIIAAYVLYQFVRLFQSK